jgi:hypothetical protein
MTGIRKVAIARLGIPKSNPLGQLPKQKSQAWNLPNAGHNRVPALAYNKISQVGGRTFHYSAGWSKPHVAPGRAPWRSSGRV